MLGNNQLSDPGYGPPVDAFDTACKRHKDCLSQGSLALSENFRPWILKENFWK